MPDRFASDSTAFFAAVPSLGQTSIDEIGAGLDALGSHLSVAASGAVRWRRARDRAGIGRALCLDLAAELLEEADALRTRGWLIEAFALEGIQARLVEALVASSFGDDVAPFGRR